MENSQTLIVSSQNQYSGVLLGEVSSEKGFSKWSVLIITSLSIFIIVIDTTMMNVSITALVADLDTTVNGVQGAITLYAVVIAALTLSAAKLADI